MLHYAQAALRHGGGYELEELVADEMRYLAVQRALEVVGEAAANVPPSVQAALPDIPFREAIGMRHRIIHGYATVDPIVIVHTVRNDLPPLITALEAALAEPLPDER
ncbi:MAG: HepT-like ribonuclease domain-containing protein [Oceanicaulis sp.]